MKSTKIAILIGSLILPTSAHGQAFGVLNGQSLVELNPEVAEEHKYRITPPVPHKDFELYSALWTEQTGVCAVAAETPYITNEPSGFTARSKFIDLKGSLDRKYGEGLLTEFYFSDFYERNQSNWVGGLAKNEVIFYSSWSTEEGQTLPDGLESITLQIVGKDYQTSYISLVYIFDTYDACMSIIDSKRSEGL